MKVLVTGGAGYIGCVLVQKLLEKGHQVRVLDRLYWGMQPIGDLVDRIELVKGDVRDIDPRVLDGIDAVIHLAGLSNDPTADYRPDANWQMNGVATERLARACKSAGIKRLTFGSSCSIYDGLPPGVEYDETAPVSPIGAYATTKYYAEQKLLELADDDFCPVILRQGTVYGHSPRMRFDLVVNTFVKDALIHRKLFLHGGGWMWRPLVEVRDVAEIHIACLEAPEELVRGQIFNVVQGNYQIRQLAMLVAGSLSLISRPVELVNAPQPARVRDYRCSGLKLKQTLGIEPKITVLESIEDMLGKIALDAYAEMCSPRYYNIQWMTLLEEAASILKPYEDPWDCMLRKDAREAEAPQRLA
jgi:nucleoside-diphosphate-sugar epimerase